MKKIALLFTLLCASILNGMEPQTISSLPEELQKEITNTVNEIIKQGLTTNNLEEAINTIKVAMVLQGIRYDSLKEFTVLVHILANKFNSSAEKVATQFKTSTSDKYMRLAVELIEAIKNKNIDKITELIAQGADVNYYEKDPTAADRINPLTHAVKIKDAKIVKLLLDSGAKPTQRLVTETMLFSGDQPEIVGLLFRAFQKK